MANETQERPQLVATLERDFSGFEEMGIDQIGGLPATVQNIIMANSREITAKKVAIPREIPKILQQIKVYCASFGDGYVYSWEANDRQNKRKSLIEGGTIKLANDLLGLYGNCSVDVDLTETNTHWLFKAWFIDYEKGVATSRMFQQRKGQQTGMRDADRQADIVFQIGQSKAIRNVILNALSSFSDFAIEEAKNGLIAKFEDAGNKAKAQAFIKRVMDEHGIAFIRVEAVVGRKKEEWTVRDLARVYTEMKGIGDGLTSVDDVYPSEADAAVVAAAKATKAKDGMAATAQEGDPKPTEAPKPTPAPTQPTPTPTPAATTAAPAATVAPTPASTSAPAPPPTRRPSLFNQED